VSAALERRDAARMPPSDVPASLVVRELISRGKPPSVVIDFPMFDDAGKPIAKVRIRLLTDSEQTMALANARAEVARLVKDASRDLPWRPEEMEHNTRATEILAVACRLVRYRCEAHPVVAGYYPHACPTCGEAMTEYVDDKNLDPPFFDHGVLEARRYFRNVELGTLWNAYASLQDKSHPNLYDMSEAEMRAWIDVIARGTRDLPFSYFSRGQLEILTTYCAESLVALERQQSGQDPTSSSPSES
jgi:hypothetical protein